MMNRLDAYWTTTAAVLLFSLSSTAPLAAQEALLEPFLDPVELSGTVRISTQPGPASGFLDSIETSGSVQAWQDGRTVSILFTNRDGSAEFVQYDAFLLGGPESEEDIPFVYRVRPGSKTLLNMRGTNNEAIGEGLEGTMPLGTVWRLAYSVWNRPGTTTRWNEKTGVLDISTGGNTLYRVTGPMGRATGLEVQVDGRMWQVFEMQGVQSGFPGFPAEVTFSRRDLSSSAEVVRSSLRIESVRPLTDGWEVRRDAAIKDFVDIPPYHSYGRKSHKANSFESSTASKEQSSRKLAAEAVRSESSRRGTYMILGLAVLAGCVAWASGKRGGRLPSRR